MIKLITLAELAAIDEDINKYANDVVSRESLENTFNAILKWCKTKNLILMQMLNIDNVGLFFVFKNIE